MALVNDDRATMHAEANGGLIDGFSDTFVPVVRPGTLRHALGDELILWAEDAPQSVYLDPFATVIHDVLDGVASVVDLTEDIHEVFEIERGPAARQLERVLRIIDEGHLIENPDRRPPTSGDLSVRLLPEPDR